MSSLIKVLLFDWMVTWRGPEGVGLVGFFFIVTQVAFLSQKLQDEQNPRGYPENPVGWDGA